MSDIWREEVTRAEFKDMYDIGLTDEEWLRMTEAFDDAIANVIAEFL